MVRMRARPLSAIGRIADSNRTSPQTRKLLNGDMRELQHLILHGLVSALVRAKPYTLLSLLKAASLIKLDKRAAEAVPILGTPVEPI